MLLYLLPIISSQFQPYSVIKHLTIPEKVKHQVNIVRLFSSDALCVRYILMYK